MKWNFKELTQGDDFQGIRDGDIELFDKTRYQSVVREAIQNSLDARLNEAEPVKIEFNYFKVDKIAFPNIAKIENHLFGCKKWEKANDDDKELIQTMCNAISKQILLFVFLSCFSFHRTLSYTHKYFCFTCSLYDSARSFDKLKLLKN